MNISNKELSKSLIQQVNSLREILDDLEYQLDHIKTHGALYNLSANNYDLSMLIIEIISEYYNDTLLYVPSGSLIEKLAIENNINIRKEIFWIETIIMTTPLFQEQKQMLSLTPPN